MTEARRGVVELRRVLRRGGTLSGRILRGLSEFGSPLARRVAGRLLPAASLVLNAIAAPLTRVERLWHSGPFVLPMGLILVGWRPGER